MVVVMSAEATDAQLDAICERVRKAGGEAFVSRGHERIIIGLIGQVDEFHALNLRRMDGVADVIRVSTPYKLVALEPHRGRSSVLVGPTRVAVGPDTFTLIAGPCAVESYGQTLEAAEMAMAAGATLMRGGAFKPSNSTSDFPGLGEEALKILADTRETTGLPFVTELIDPREASVAAAYADMLQIGARNMHNTALLQAAAESGLPVLLKRGADATIEEWLMAAESIAQRGNLDIILCERGIRTFEPLTATTLDLSAVPLVQSLSHLPVIVDPTHAPGRRDLVLPLSRASMAAGADGILVDVNPDPDTALCDGMQALSGAAARELASAVRRIPPIVGRSPTLE